MENHVLHHTERWGHSYTWILAASRVCSKTLCIVLDNMTQTVFLRLVSLQFKG